MAMDDKQRAKLAERLKGQKERGKSVWWRPEEGKNLIRFTPYPHGDDPFIEYYYHYNLSSDKKPVLCPKRTFGKECPVCDFVATLWKGENSDEKLAKQLNAKQRIHSPVIDRNREEDGIKLYSYGGQLYEKLLETMLDPDFGDITDPKNGCDVLVRYEKASAGNPFPKTDITVKPKETPMLEAGKEAWEELLEACPNMTDLVPEHTAEELEDMLKALAGVGEEEDDTGTGTDYNDEEDTDKVDFG